MELFFSTTELLIAFWIGFVVVALSLVFRSSLSFSRKMIIVPLTFLSLYVTITQSIELLGKPYDGVPEGEFVFVSYRVKIDPETKEKSILLWTNSKEGDRLYILPYDEQAKKKLQQSAKKSKKGVMQMGKFAKKDRTTRNRLETSIWEDMKLYDFPMQQLIPKDNPNQ